MGNTYHQAPETVASAPPGCPVHDSWSPLDDDYLADPYPIATALSGEHPIFYASELGHAVVTRMEDIETVFMNPEVFASTNVQDPIFPLAPEAAATLAADLMTPLLALAVLVIVGLGVLIGSIGSAFAVTRYLDV